MGAITRHQLRTGVLALAAALIAAGGAMYVMTRTLGPPLGASALVSAAWISALALFLFDRKFVALLLTGVALIASLNWLASVVRC